MQPKTTVWELEPHTAAKHEILRRYVQAWAPILSQGNFPHLVFIDGFAGPGRYSKGEEGSPIIAIKAVIEQSYRIKAKVDFHFIELDKDRAYHLAAEVRALQLPPNITTMIHGERSFQEVFPQIWNRYAPKAVGHDRRRSSSLILLVLRFHSRMLLKSCALKAVKC